MEIEIKIWKLDNGDGANEHLLHVSGQLLLLKSDKRIILLHTIDNYFNMTSANGCIGF